MAAHVTHYKGSLSRRVRARIYIKLAPPTDRTGTKRVKESLIENDDKQTWPRLPVTPGRQCRAPSQPAGQINSDLMALERPRTSERPASAADLASPSARQPPTECTRSDRKWPPDLSGASLGRLGTQADLACCSQLQERAIIISRPLMD